MDMSTFLDNHTGTAGSNMPWCYTEVLQDLTAGSNRDGCETVHYGYAQSLQYQQGRLRRGRKVHSWTGMLFPGFRVGNWFLLDGVLFF